MRALLLVGLAGCSVRERPRPAPTNAHPVVVRPTIIGAVAILDEEKRFVLIDLESNLYVPAPGTSLRTLNASGETGHIKASAEQKRPFIAADIVDGNPAVGDEVAR